METFGQKTTGKTETKEFSIKTSEPIPSTNPIDFKSEEDEKKISSIKLIPIIPSENPRRFNSGKELYDFLEKNKINIKDIE
jgi:hypothetical protein